MKATHPPAPGSGQASFLESPSHRQVILESIASGFLPLKFAYAGSAAYTHDRYASTADYGAMMASAAHESDTLLSLGPKASRVGAIAELGPGNGLHSVAFLQHLRHRGIRFRRYLAIDFSATLLGLASNRLRQSFDAELIVDTSVCDMEERPLSCVEGWREGDERLLTCLLGHTLGNLEDPTTALGNLGAGLRAGDVLLTSVLLRQRTAPADSAMTAYHTSAFHRAALEPLLACGLHLADLNLALRYVDDVIVGEVTLLCDARLAGMDLPAGHQFRCFLSRRFVRQDVEELIERAGWSIRASRVDQTGHHMTVAATRE